MATLSMQDALQQFLKKSRLQKGIQAVQIEEVWEDLMGKTIARHTDQIGIVGATLHIVTTVAPLRNELLFQKQTIIQRINEKFGEEVIREVMVR
jgi:hypothetical protein